MSLVVFSFSFFLGIKIVCKMGMVSKPYIFVCVLIDSDTFLFFGVFFFLFCFGFGFVFFVFVLLLPYDFVLNPKMPVSLRYLISPLPGSRPCAAAWECT